MKPNIFDIATKELSQDGFFTWLLQWADPKNSQYNQPLNETAKDFVRLLLKESSDFQIQEVKTQNQWKNIDICAEINGKYFIFIEDKTNAGEHSGQLDRYKKKSEEWFKGNKYEKFICIYLKTGNESLFLLEKVEKQCFSVIDRKAVLSVLNKREVANDIFNDFKERLKGIEEATNSFIEFKKMTSEWRAAEGFFMALEKQISELTKPEWRYVANPTGGFLGFWYHWKEITEVGKIYIQIENSVKGNTQIENPIKASIQLVIKIKFSASTPSTETLYRVFGEIEPVAKKQGLTILKPTKYRAGVTSTLAVIENAFTVVDGNIELDKFRLTLKKLEQTLDEYFEKVNSSPNEILS